MKGITRTELNQLMAIPEARQIIEARYAELRLIFKERLGDAPGADAEYSRDDSARYSSQHSSQHSNIIHSNIIRFPGAGGGFSGDDDAAPEDQSPVEVIDASQYANEPEGVRAGIFLDYFRNHPELRRLILKEFFLRILPYSNIDVLERDA